MIPIVPAVIPANLRDLNKNLKNLSFSNEIHIDVVDGDFVPTTSWPFDPAGEPVDAAEILNKFSLEVDLMTSDPLVEAERWVLVGVDMLMFHLESIALGDFKNLEAFMPASIGISAHGDTTIEALLEYAQYADYVQLMGIREIGSMKQPFDSTVLDKIREVKKFFPDKMVSIDGSVNAGTISQLKSAGADRFVVGSSITLQDDPRAAHMNLSDLIK